LKVERSDVDLPLWRKKVDSSLFRENGTTIPAWACTMWGIQQDFSNCRSKKDLAAQVKVIFKNKEFVGSVTIAPLGRKTPAYRLFYNPVLSYDLQNVFLMSFVRDIEGRLREINEKDTSDVEKEIPFWEFLDIEYDRQQRTFYFSAHYTMMPTFRELFKHFTESPLLHKIDDELREKPPFRIYKTDWKPREKLDFEHGERNVLYMLIDTKEKLLYVGEAANLVDRLRQEHPSIPKWNYFRYSVLPNEIADHREVFERMLICDFATMLNGLPTKDQLIYKLVNSKIDTV
jgi:hypothetical protein